MAEPILKRFDDFLNNFSEKFVDCIYNKNIDKYVTENSQAGHKIHNSLLYFAVEFRKKFHRNDTAINIGVLQPKVKVFLVS
jgi:hypothetical protein